MVHPLVGKPAPAISLPAADGETYTLTPGAKGVPVALFFYPKSGSYGCTKEACQFRDALAEKDLFKRTKVEIVGVSSDAVDKQKTFVEKQKLTYPILSDPDGEARKAYHVGKGLFGLAETARVTFFIDSKGTVRDVLDTTLNYSAHVKFVSKWLDKLEAEEKKAAEAPADAAAPAADTEGTAASAPTEGAGAAPAETPSSGELGRAAQAVQA
ncbi:AhpC-TSA-domain-containing protein [Dichomitus squalens LYAD-421 SS1]|uniref:thioredoxin-dependent peroxiredoxin n=2 Tax=Dichomitus squalens TaxID=114155 RepID=A0A4Q9MDZ9_9APHY|nr:AhpC-TSA-domain-containing protein [Dichomitus squalens LYAD-421 SS1]EJF63383.1 AhpC-TSA-domain-containing protein [Dichomitus squalens LYAD-421 SS1]TBU24056.1 AhpC-TSA-domain-containing protein [Dichomitus squalens]